MAESTSIPSSTPGKDSPTRRSLSSTPPPPSTDNSTASTAATMLTMTTLRTPMASSMTSGIYSSGGSSSSNGGHKSGTSPNPTSPLAASTPCGQNQGSISNEKSHSHSNNNNHHHNHNSSHHASTSSSSSSSTTTTTATATHHHSGHIPTSKSYSAAELKRKPSLHVALSSKSATSTLGHNGSSDSLNKSPISPGSILGEEPAEDKELTYKVQRKNYRLEKLRVAQELSTALKNPSIIILSGSLKVRGKLKGWTKLWAVLRPGMLLLYKSNKMKSRHWIATVLLQCCKVIERPSKKDGFCFKVFHPMEQSIWATKGPDGETMGAVVQPLPTTYLICRAASGDNGKCWMDGLELALTCSSLLLSSPRASDVVMEDKSSNETENDGEWCVSDEEEKGRSASEKSESDASHIEEFASTQIHDSDEESQTEGEYLCGQSSRKKSRYDSDLPEFSNYVENKEDFAHTQGEQSEVLADENKSLLWFLLKQVRPGMDLSRVVLPTFILEPRSFLDKLSDYYYHADILAKANLEDDPFSRMKAIVRWYLSGFYKKPKGLKKPYNPVLGETFRCLWRHPDGTETFYVAEQVSHHPPVSAFYVSNRKSGFIISSAILAKSKFYGNSTSAILEGQASLTFLNRGEVYLITMPYAHCKGILMGTLSMELGGQVTITCEKTNYSAEMEFKLKGMLSRADVTNAISGKIKYNRETIGYFDGHWDSKIIYKEKKVNSNSPVEEVLWEVTDNVKSERLTRYTIPLEEQEPWESENLWRKVSEAILADDQEAATVEKTKLEEQQRLDVKDRRTRNVEWMPKFFVYDPITSTWKYKHADYQPWDEDNDIVEYECDYVISTHRKRVRTFCRADSAVSDDSRKECDILRRTPSDQVVPAFHQRESNRKLVELLRQLLARQIEQSEQIEQLKSTVASIQEKLSRPKPPKDPFPITNTVLAVVFAVAMQIFVIIYWFGDGKLLPDVPRKRY